MSTTASPVWLAAKHEEARITRLFKSAEEKAAIAHARESYAAFAAAVSTATPSEVRELVARLKGSPALAALSERERHRRGEQAFRAYAESVLSDDILTSAEEEALLSDAAAAFGVTQDDFGTVFRDLMLRIAIAAANDGRPPTLDPGSAKLMPKKSETIHMETAAALMKEVSIREWRGGSSGVSFRIAKGVRYRVGSTRGHIVTVGTQLQAADAGILSITSSRIAYLGSRKSLDIPYSKLMGVEVFSDGVRLNASNRQNAPLFKLGEGGMGEVIAATVNAAVQKTLS